MPIYSVMLKNYNPSIHLYLNQRVEFQKCNIQLHSTRYVNQIIYHQVPKMVFVRANSINQVYGTFIPEHE